ncbi:chorismate synthase [Candidatus Peregrinibacteria bacterium]|nr:chorismate synthase [Candidatus Peregrinibacteria bacterium]
MPGNTFGTTFKITTWGESHGPMVGAVIDGCPPKLPLSEKDIQKEVDRRRPKKFSKISTTRREKDLVKIVSGVFEGKTTGIPISIIVENSDIRSQDYSKISDKYRPGHADYTYELKYGLRDFRGGGRASGRETIARVMAGAVAKKILALNAKTEIFGHTIQIGKIKAEKFDKDFIEQNELRCADKNVAKKMLTFAEEIRKQGDSTGGIIEIIIKSPPKGLGDPVFDKLEANLSKALMSIGAVKGIEIGEGFKCAEMKGSENNDEMAMEKGKVKFLSNHCGGILGGISTGEDIIIRLAIKSVPSISKELKTITKSGKNTKIQTLGRHDCCLAPRIIPVAESMAAIVLADMLLAK